MSRSLWKLPYSKFPIQSNTIFHRDSFLDSTTLHKTFYISNGRNSTKKIINKYMLGCKIGEFAMTRKINPHRK
jgi:ribosomal protein S19